MRSGLKGAWTARIAELYGHVRFCTDAELTVNGRRVENHWNHRGLAHALDEYLNGIRGFLESNEKEPELCAYYQEIERITRRARHQEVIEVPEPPNDLDDLLKDGAEEQEEKKSE